MTPTEDMKVTPYEVSGKIDYEKLIKQFGTQKLDEPLLNRIKKHTGALHHFLRRGIFFSHRDMNWLLDEYEKKNKFYLYTGRAPSGETTLGHMIPWLFTKWLQDKFNVELYFQIPDEEKFLSKKELELKETYRLSKESILDVIALGFNPKKTKIFIDTDYAKTLYKIAVQVAKKITYSTSKATFGFNDETNIGLIFYTAMQSVPALLKSVQEKKNIPCLIPLAIDQDPHFRLTRDIAPKLGFYKPAIIHCRFLPALWGPGKMSSSDPQSTIYVTDDEKTVEHKIKKYAFSGGRDTIEEHRKLGGNPDIDVSYQYLTFFEEDDKKLKKIYDDYKSGKLLTSELKQITIEKINKFLKEHQKRREKARKNIHKFLVKD